MRYKRFTLLLAAASLVCALLGARASAQVICPVTELTSGLQLPLGITQSNQGNLLVSESGPRGTKNTGRVTILGLDGSRRTLLAGLPSGPNDVGDPSGPAGLYLRGRTLYVAIGMGDVVVGVGIPGAGVPNPNGPSSPIFSSVLAVHFSAHVEKTTEGFTLTLADQQALAAGQRVMLSNGGGDKVTIELVANFPDYVPNPLPILPANVRHSNPFDLIAIGNQLYVTDGGRNLVWQVDINSGAFFVLAEFPPIPNPLPIGPPVVDAVPTGIDYADGQLLVALFRGFPFPAGTSVVEQVDPVTGAHAPFISGLRTAMDVLAVRKGGDTDYLVLQHSSAGVAPLPPFANPGRLLHFEEPGDAPTVIADCLIRPTSMTLDEKTGTLYVTEYAGRVVKIDAAQLFVRQHYLDFLGREPDQEGLQFWAGQITGCGDDPQCAERKRVDVSRAFFYSGEFITGNPSFAEGLRGTRAYNEAFVEQCYLRYLQRPPDAEGLQFWAGKLNRRVPRVGDGDYSEMIRAFIVSGEYQTRLNP